MMKKLTKAEVNYGKPRRGVMQRCFICKHFRAKSRTCEIVEGEIEPSYLCDEFERA